MSVGYARLELTKGNEMKKTEIASGGLVELVKSKTNLTDIGAYAYGLTIVWALADDKLKNKVIELIESEV
jgi:hypothetical protein